VEVLAAIRQALDAAGLAQVGGLAPDTCSLQYWVIPRMLEAGADPDPYIQAYCLHHYHSHYDWDQVGGSIKSDPLSVTMEQQLARYVQYARERKKPFFVGELGMFHYGWATGDPAGVGRHDNALLETEFILRALNQKVDAVLRWAWLNPGNLDGWWQLLNTLDASDAPTPHSYPAYASLYRFIDRQPSILETTVASPAGAPPTVWAAAVENKDCSRALFVLNDAYANCAKIAVRFPAGRGPVRKLVNDHLRKYHDCGIIASGAADVEHADILSPQSLTVYTTRDF